jgi:hypothetical protein
MKRCRQQQGHEGLATSSGSVARPKDSFRCGDEHVLVARNFRHAGVSVTPASSALQLPQRTQLQCDCRIRFERGFGADTAP